MVWVYNLGGCSCLSGRVCGLASEGLFYGWDNGGLGVRRVWVCMYPSVPHRCHVSFSIKKLDEVSNWPFFIATNSIDSAWELFNTFKASKYS